MEAQVHTVEAGSALAAERIVASALVLARAEAELALARARVLVTQMMGILLATMLTAAAAQVVLMVIALSPMLFKGDGWSAVVFALAPACGLMVLGASVAWMTWQKLRNTVLVPAVGGQS